MLIEIPAKVVTGTADTVTSFALWPYNSGGDDLYWSGGVQPRPYQWQVSISVAEQSHSSFRTRKPYAFNGSDISVGDYVADIAVGICLKIVSITSKSDAFVTCIVEDVLRYNTFRDPSGLANGIFTSGSSLIIFELNEEGQPVLDPAPVGITATALTNITSRFSNFEETYNFILEKAGHGFSVGELISADSSSNSFVLADAAHPYIVGTVSNTDLGPDEFMVTPFQKIIDGYDSLIGNVGSVVFADPNNAGAFSLDGTQPVMVKLRQETNTVVTGSLLTPDSGTTVGSTFNVNFFPLAITNTGTPADFVATVNTATGTTGVTAELVEEPPTVQTDPALLNGFGIVVIQVPSEVLINGSSVTFTTTTSGSQAFGDGYADQYDIAVDINAASISGIVATATNTGMSVSNTALGPITFTNVTPDVMGNNFAGTNSSSGLALSTSSGNSYITLTAAGAAAINLLDTNNDPCVGFGLFSAENGVKAAALYVEQGIRQAATYVVADIPARDALTVLPGDQVFVQDTGNGEWSYYIRTFSNTWIKISDQDSSETDAQSVEVTVNFDSDVTGIIHTISNGRRVSFVTVTVTEAFDTAATITVGDSSDNDRLMTADQNDLSNEGGYSTTPSFTYTGGSDTDISYYFNAASATQGSAVIAITYT